MNQSIINHMRQERDRLSNLHIEATERALETGGNTRSHFRGMASSYYREVARIENILTAEGVSNV